jgi:glycosyltransferase involved in cell wall biosynthesis
VKVAIEMRVVHVTYTDFEGRRFNGYDLRRPFMEVGVESRMLVWEKYTRDEWVSTILPGRLRHKVKGGLEAIESAYSMQSVLYPFPMAMLANRSFKETDVAHYQMIHNSFYSLRCLPRLTAAKPTIWSLHDPWPLTGHCIHPYGCEKWESGCGGCTELDSPKRMRSDKTHQMWEFKRKMYARSDFDVVVASKWMEERVKRSPLMEGKRVHRVPIGVDLERFKPSAEERRDHKFTIMLRASNIRFKGLEQAKRVLSLLPEGKDFRILAIDERGLLDDFREKHDVFDLGRVDDAALIAAYQSADVFLMPSTAESFGMMAVEAAACGVPTICLKGTAVEEVAGDGGLAYPADDPAQAVGHILSMAESEARMSEARNKALDNARRNYDIRQECTALKSIYEDVIARTRR